MHYRGGHQSIELTGTLQKSKAGEHTIVSAEAMAERPAMPAKIARD